VKLAGRAEGGATRDGERGAVESTPRRRRTVDGRKREIISTKKPT